MSEATAAIAFVVSLSRGVGSRLSRALVLTGSPVRGLPPDLGARCGAFPPSPATYCRIRGSRLPAP